MLHTFSGKLLDTIIKGDICIGEWNPKPNADINVSGLVRALRATCSCDRVAHPRAKCEEALAYLSHRAICHRLGGVRDPVIVEGKRIFAARATRADALFLTGRAECSVASMPIAGYRSGRRFRFVNWHPRPTMANMGHSATIVG